MIEERERYERAFQQFQMTEPAWEILVDRRDRKRRNQRIAAGVVGIAVFVAAVWIVTSAGSLDRSETSVVPGGDVTGPAVPEPTQTAVIGGEDDCQEDCLAKEIPGVRLPDSKPAPALPALIGTVTQSRAGCALEIVAEPIPSDARRLRLVNEMNRWVSFNVVRLESVRLFAQLEAIVANGNYTPFADRQPTGAFSLGPRAVGPGASGTFTDYGATPGGAYAVVCFDREHFPGGLYPLPHGGHFAVVGPIVVR